MRYSEHLPTTPKGALRLLHRGLQYASRITVACHNIGVADTMRTLVLGRHRSNETSVHLAGIGRDFAFRGCLDFGVLSHFFLRGVRIVDNPEQPVRRIIDAGAHIGDETCRFRHNHPNAEIVAVEADKDNVALLLRNLASEPVVVRHAALWNAQERLALANGGTREETHVCGTAKDDDLAGGVEGITVDQIMRDQGWEEIDILKIDIEGAEAAVFEQGTAAWLPRVRAIIVECPDNDAPGTTQRIFAALARHGIQVRCYIHGENLVLIRADVDYRVDSQLWYGNRSRARLPS